MARSATAGRRSRPLPWSSPRPWEDRDSGPEPAPAKAGVEPGRTPLDAGQHELLDGIEADRTELHRLHDTGGHNRLLEYLQQSQDLNELLLAAIAHAALEQPAHALELLGQVPALQR